MSDIPQLRADLVRAGARRRRRARARTAVLAAASVAVAAVALTRLEPPPEREAPARLSDSDRLERAFGVFRRPARRADRFPVRHTLGPRSMRARVLRARFVARLGDARYYLVQTDKGLCLLTRDGGGGCGGIAHYLDGKHPQGSYSDEEGPADLVFAFPDGVRDVSVLTTAGEVLDVDVENNAIGVRVRSRAAQLRWTAPDGSPQRIEFHPAPAVQPGDSYSVLANGGEQLVAEDGDARAWLSDREGRLCLRVQAAGEEMTGCRDKPADVRRALVVILAAGDRRVLAAAFPDGAGRVRLQLTNGRSRPMTVRKNAILVADAAGVDAIRYRSPARRRVIDRLPASARSAVLNGEPRR